MTKAAILTGASSGIGEALALELARRGYDLGLTARRMPLLEQLRQRIAEVSANLKVELRALDVTDTDAVRQVLPELAGSLGMVGLIIANAGVGGSRKAGDAKFANDERIIRTNLLGAMATVDTAVKIFREGSLDGQIVGISSVAAFRGLPTSAAYSASKAGFTTYLEGVRAEVEAEGITVTTISPGFIDTPINQDMKSRPFVIDAKAGATQIADLIERRVRHSTVPAMPWGPVGVVMRSLPDWLWYRVVSGGIADRGREL
jgi:short-subunit dehydrogenase